MLSGTAFTMNAQDRLVLRNGRTIEVKMQRSLDDRVEYTYPGETTVYERPKSAISAIYYEDGRREILDENIKNREVSSSDRSSRSSSSNTSVSRANSQTNSEGVSLQDVKTTFTAEDVTNLKRLQRVTARSRVSYKDAILQLKKKAAEIGGTTVLVMDDPDSTEGEEIEVIGIAYRDESVPVARPAVTASRESTSTPAQTSSNTRRRRILQQMEGYNNDSKLDLSEEPAPRREPSGTASTAGRERASEGSSKSPDAVHLLSGRVIYGVIEELEPDDFVSIRTNAGKVYEYSMDDVRRVQRTSTDKSSGRSTASSRTPSRKNTDYEDDDYDYIERQSRRSSRDQDGIAGSVSGYKGTFDVGYTLPVGIGERGRIEAHTSHGYQLNDYLFVGAGVGLHVFSARDPLLKENMKTNDKFPQYVDEVTINNKKYTYDSVTYVHGADSMFMVLPLFLDVRGYYPMGKIVPFVMFRVGYSFNLTDGFGGMGLYMNPAIGAKFNLSDKLGLTVSLGYSMQSYGGIPMEGGYGFWYYNEKKDISHLYEAKSAGGFTLKLGVEF
jgi:hypothetical protein